METLKHDNYFCSPAKDDHSAHKVRSDDVDSGYKKSVTKTAAKAKPVITTTAADSSDT